MITVTLGLVFDLSKVKSIFSPFLLYAVMEGIPVGNKKPAYLQNLEIILIIIVCIYFTPDSSENSTHPSVLQYLCHTFKLHPPPFFFKLKKPLFYLYFN